jgi:hypothetical protein
MERDKCLYYKRGYKYATTRDYRAKLDIIPYAPFSNDFFSMDMEGNVVIFKRYAWDGCSGPTIDRNNNMIAGLLHDAGYQMIRLGLIDSKYKDYLDDLLHNVMVEDGAWGWEADLFHWGVMEFGAGSCRPSAEPQELIAP